MANRFIDSKIGPDAEGAGFSDIPLGVGDSFEAVGKSFGASLESDQLEISRKMLKKYLSEVEEATGEALDPFQGISETARGNTKGTEGGFVFGMPFADQAAKYDVRIKELEARFPGKFKAKTTADLREDFLVERERIAQGDGREKNAVGAIGAGIVALATDFPTVASMIISGAASAGIKGATLGGKVLLDSTISGISEAAIQSQLEGTAQEKGLAVLGATLGPSVFRALGVTSKGAARIASRGVAKVLRKSGNSTSKFIAETEKALVKLSPDAQALAKSELSGLKAYGGRLDEALLAKGNQRTAFAAGELVADASAGVKFNFKVPFKSTIKQLDRSAVGKKAADNLKRFAKRRSDAGLAPREVLKELLLAKPDVNADAALRDLDALTRGGQDLNTVINARIASQSVPPLTSTGKFATNLEKVAVIGKKGAPLKGKTALKASIFDTLEEARTNLTRLNKDPEALANLQVFKTKEGKFAIVGNTDIKTLPKGGSYLTKEAALEAAPRFAKKFNVDLDELSPVRTRFFNEKTGNTDFTYKLALRATERDLKAFDLDLPGSMEESYLRMQTSAPVVAPEPSKSILTESFDTITTAPVEILDVGGRMDRLTAVEGASALGYKKLNGQVKNLQEVAKALKACNI